MEVKVEVTTPQALVAAFGTVDWARANPLAWQAKRKPRPLFQLLELYQVRGEGGLGPTGTAWRVGAIADTDMVLHIFAVPWIEMARFFNESAALIRWGFSRISGTSSGTSTCGEKACPRHQAVLAELLGGVDRRNRPLQLGPPT